MMRLLALTLGLLAAACGEVEPAAEYDSLITLDATGALTIDGEPSSLVGERFEATRRRLREIARRETGPIDDHGVLIGPLARVRVEVDPRTPFWAIGSLTTFLGLLDVLITKYEITTSDGSLAPFRPRLPLRVGTSDWTPFGIDLVDERVHECSPAVSAGYWCVHESNDDGPDIGRHGVSWSSALDAVALRRWHANGLTLCGVLDRNAPWSEVRPLAARLEALDPEDFLLFASL